MCQFVQHQWEDYSPAVFSPFSFSNMNGLGWRSLHWNDFLTENASWFHPGPSRRLRWGCERLICLTLMRGWVLGWSGVGGGRLKNESATCCASLHKMTITDSRLSNSFISNEARGQLNCIRLAIDSRSISLFFLSVTSSTLAQIGSRQASFTHIILFKTWKGQKKEWKGQTH